ncbi:MAG: hypothetical protein HY097_11055, partial [Nitrospinae bacterium]|nr:hypothetical protein [Nitrospinota bacterium]
MGPQGEKQINSHRNKNQVFLSAIFILAAFLGLSHEAVACKLPIKGQTFDANAVESGNFAVNLSIIYSPFDVIQVENAVKARQSIISSRLSEISIIMKDKASIEGFRNIKDHISRIKTLEEEKVSIRETIVSSWQDVVNQSNNTAARKEWELRAQLPSSLTEKDTEIMQTKQKVKDARKNLREIFDKVGFTCNREPETCIAEAVTYMDENIKKAVNESFRGKERELVVARELVRGAGDPEKEIHRLTRDLVNNLKTT